MKKSLLLLGIICLLIGTALIVILRYPPTEYLTSHYTATTQLADYQEYQISLSSKDSLQELDQEPKVLHYNSQVVERIRPTMVELTEVEHAAGVFEKYSYNNDIYELRVVEKWSRFRLLKNNEIVFETEMDFGSDGPVLDWTLINDQLAVTYRKDCDDAGNCGADIYYNGQFISEQYGVTNPKYPFIYNNTIGFIAQDELGNRVYFNGKFITPAFTSIHTYNCCAVNEVLPTIYNNGTLLFFATREDEHYLVEVLLQ